MKAATRSASRWSIARLFGNTAPARGKKGFGDLGYSPYMGSRTYMVSPGSPVWMDRDYAKFAMEGYIRNVIAHRCIGMVAQGAASVPVKLFSMEDGIRRPVLQHPLLELLSRPNPAQAHASFMEAIYQYRLIAGNGFVQAIGPVGTAPQELHVLRPDRVAIIAGENGQPAAYRYTVNGEYRDFPIDPVSWMSRVLHVKTFHPLNDWYGLSPIEAVAYSIDQHNQAGAWNQALLQNGARPSGALVVKGADGQPGSLSEDQYYRLKTQIDEQFSGPVNAGRPMLLEGGLDWKELSLSPKDMDFIQSKNTSARDIALGFGVPPQMLGIPGDNTYANLQEARLALWEQTIVPLARSTIHAIGHWLAPMFDGTLELCPDFDGISALATKNQAVWNMVQNASFLTDDEKRAAVGYHPLAAAKAMHVKDDGDDEGDDGDDEDYSDDDEDDDEDYSDDDNGDDADTEDDASDGDAESDDDGQDGTINDDTATDSSGGAPPDEMAGISGIIAGTTPGGINYDGQIQSDMDKRDWTEEEMDAAQQTGPSIDAIDMETGEPATRSIHPDTGKSVVINDNTNEVVHLGGTGFKYGPGSGDVEGAVVRPGTLVQTPDISPGGGGGGAGAFGDIFHPGFNPNPEEFEE